jgi:hypothetical protein
MKKLYLLLLLLFVNTSNIAQINPGARQISIANADVALANDVFTLFNNPAGLAQINWKEVGVYYSPAPFGLTELANGYVAYQQPFSFGSLGIGGMTYGYELYRESKIILGYSYNYDNILFLGAAINYQTYSIQNYGSTGVFYLNLGGLVYILDDLRWGFSTNNINRATVGDQDDQIPVVFSTGFSFEILQNFSLNASLVKDIRYDLSLAFGIDYDIIEYLSLRIGAADNPSKFTAGVGINYSILGLDYAFFTHPDLGLTHQVGLTLSFGKEGIRSEAIKKYLQSN